MEKLSISDMAVFCKSKGFVYPNSEIYNGVSGLFDYGPLGTELKNNIKQDWWKTFVQERDDIYGLDGCILSHQDIWKSSGHVEFFEDIMVECTKCKERTRADNLIEDKLKIPAEGLNATDINKIIKENKLACPKCKSELKEAENFNLMFNTSIGPVQNNSSVSYLRPETAQLIFADFKAISETMRVKLPFGIAQAGKAFRNEISPRDFLFRTREFEQMEIEFFLRKDQHNKCPYLKQVQNIKINLLTAAQQKKKEKHKEIKINEMLKEKMLTEWHAYWLSISYKWFLDLGINKEKLRIREHLKKELSHYSSATFDIEYLFPMGWKEIHGNANRGNFDLMQHKKFSKENLDIFDEEAKQKILPEVIEPSQGLDRAFLSFMFDSYNFDKKRGNVVLKLHPKISPYKAAIFPLVNKLDNDARKVYDLLKKDLNCFYDTKGSIGKRYARMDEIGTPICITIDFQTKEDSTVTLRDRDTTKQVRIKVDELKDSILKILNK
ncbi:MAG: glycine--tRNA ligase [Candidatus Woesearchaeota archaeon]|jgi:glycyl-tRNA synthetase|nr:glycine--tRNA ligase [Candidatus Woesearchaeota archaeon]MDP7623179.1 glycine--tRNA ligase [Candidatus Woesearchaeota archaeon]HJN56764.1 glycine--tRNA ligase [Candidatus Woesearchaeota archaeon]|tara:strand:+ start:6480 stop:7964 length:1485 start_codon:yes stop_codon:yes gene_type:complete